MCPSHHPCEHFCSIVFYEPYFLPLPSPSHLSDWLSSISVITCPGSFFPPTPIRKILVFPGPSSHFILTLNTLLEQFQHLHAFKGLRCARDSRITISKPQLSLEPQTRSFSQMSLSRLDLQGLLPSSLASLQSFIDLTHCFLVFCPSI